MWFWYALFVSIWTSISISFSKKISKDTDPFVYIAFTNLVTLVPLSALTFLATPAQVDSSFFFYLLLASIFNAGGNICFYKALRITPMSLLAPFTVCNLVISTVAGYLIFHDNLETMKLAGILIVIVGSYLINVEDIRKGALAPLKDIINNKGVLLTILAFTFWGISPFFEKNALTHITPQQPLLLAFYEVLIMVGLFLPYVLFKKRHEISSVIRYKWYYILPAPITAIAYIAIFRAFSEVPVGYPIAVFKLNMLFLIIWGYLFFNEKKIGERLLGAVCMIFGAILLVL